ncbi:hypothetical protein Sjap_018559 [Stephania japonica]|uniref:Uncharacterized protein n=1 Tax=Stephania japonica TaxID=461633 RepID=A0AAP0NL92_9MAGN
MLYCWKSTHTFSNLLSIEIVLYSSILYHYPSTLLHKHHLIHFFLLEFFIWFTSMAVVFGMTFYLSWNEICFCNMFHPLHEPMKAILVLKREIYVGWGD